VGIETWVGVFLGGGVGNLGMAWHRVGGRGRFLVMGWGFGHGLVVGGASGNSGMGRDWWVKGDGI
jgi:hypothetical protein